MALVEAGAPGKARLETFAGLDAQGIGLALAVLGRKGRKARRLRRGHEGGPAGDLDGVGDGLGDIGETRLHHLGRHQVTARGGVPARALGQVGLVGDAQEGVMRGLAALAGVMRLRRGHERQAEMAGRLQEGGLPRSGGPGVTLQFDVEVLAEDGRQRLDGRRDLLAGVDHGLDQARLAARQGDDLGRIRADDLGQGVEGERRRGSGQVARIDHAQERGVARIAGGDQHQGALDVAMSDLDHRADDRLDAGARQGLRQGQRTAQGVVVGEADRRHVVLAAIIDHVLRFHGTEADREERVGAKRNIHLRASFEFDVHPGTSKTKGTSRAQLFAFRVAGADEIALAILRMRGQLSPSLGPISALAMRRHTMQMNIAEAKAKLSELIAAAERGEEVVLARGGHPVVRIVAAFPTKPKFRFGVAAGEVDRVPDFLEPMAEDELARWE